MGKAKPCLGYPSRTAAALALQAEGLNYKQIAAKIGINPCAASALICASKSSNKRSTARLQKTVCVDDDILDALRPAAIRRGISVNKLCRQLLGCIADDNITDAILDDALELAEC